MTVRTAQFGAKASQILESLCSLAMGQVRGAPQPSQQHAARVAGLVQNALAQIASQPLPTSLSMVVSTEM